MSPPPPRALTEAACEKEGLVGSGSEAALLHLFHKVCQGELFKRLRCLGLVFCICFWEAQLLLLPNGSWLLPGFGC